MSFTFQIEKFELMMTTIQITFSQPANVAIKKEPDWVDVSF
jgi:hypothetical protein